MDATVCAGGAENLHRVAARRPSPTRPTRPIRRPARNPRPAPNGSPPGDLGTGSIGLAEDRTAAAEEHLLAGHTTRLRYLAMDLSATYRCGAPTGLTLIADAFHLVKLANRKIDEAFRRLGYCTDAPYEAHNRTAKLVARNARGFANPGNQARRVRMATTRAARQAPPAPPPTVTGSSQIPVAVRDV